MTPISEWEALQDSGKKENPMQIVNIPTDETSQRVADIEYKATNRAIEAAVKGEAGVMGGKEAITEWAEENWPDYLTETERKFMEGE